MKQTFTFCKLMKTYIQNAYKPVTQSIRGYPALPKRYYRKVDVVSNGNNSYEITLDQKKLKTPKGNTLEVNNETLALAIAAEWDSQENDIQRSFMHLTSLSNTALDNPLNMNRLTLIPNLMNYLFTDVVLYHNEEVDELYRLQLEEWNPVIEIFNKKYDLNITPITDISMGFVDEAVRESLRRHLSSYSVPCLQGLTFAAETLKSLILTMCCFEQDITVEKAVLLSRLEEEFQIENWGRIEWAHNSSHADSLSRVSAAVMFTRLNLESSVVKSK